MMTDIEKKLTAREKKLLEGILESMPANDWAFCQKDQKPIKYPRKGKKE